MDNTVKRACKLVAKIKDPWDGNFMQLSAWIEVRKKEKGPESYENESKELGKFQAKVIKAFNNEDEPDIEKIKKRTLRALGFVIHQVQYDHIEEKKFKIALRHFNDLDYIGFSDYESLLAMHEKLKKLKIHPDSKARLESQVIDYCLKHLRRQRIVNRGKLNTLRDKRNQSEEKKTRLYKYINQAEKLSAEITRYEFRQAEISSK